MPESFIPAFTEADLAAIKRLIAEDRARRRSTSSSPVVDWDEGQTAPEVYVALTPQTGIPALVEGPDVGTAEGTGDLPGSVECKVFRLIPPVSTGSMTGTGVTKRIYNLSQQIIPGNNWILVSRDKFGQWYAPPQLPSAVSPQSATGCGCWVGQPLNSCLQVDLISVGTGMCSCIPLNQGPWYLYNSGYGLCWSQVYFFDTNDFETCCLYGSGAEATGSFTFCLDQNFQPYLYLAGTFRGCRFTTGSSTPFGTGTADLGPNVTNPRFAFDYCTLGPTAYFRGSGSNFCNGNLAEDDCANTFVLRVQPVGFLSCILPVTGCCPNSLPGILYLNIQVFPGAPTNAFRFAGNWALVSNGTNWSAFKEDPNPDGTPNQDTVTIACGGGVEIDGVWYWSPTINLLRLAWLSGGDFGLNINLTTGPAGATCDSPVSGGGVYGSPTTYVQGTFIE